MTDFFADLEAQLRAAHGRAPSRARRAARPALVAVSLALVAGAAVALAVALGGGGSRGEPAGTHRVVPVSGRRAVAVLNGTTTPGLAKRVGTLLADEGFRVMLVTNARTPDVVRTVVQYRPGAEGTALAAAVRLGVPVTPPLVVPTNSAHSPVTVIAGDDALERLGARPPAAAPVLLRPPRGSARGAAVVVAGSPPRFMIAGSHFVRGLYGVWLAGDSGTRRSLGDATEARGDGMLALTGPLPSDAGRFTKLLVVRENGQRPPQPEQIALEGRLRFP